MQEIQRLKSLSQQERVQELEKLYFNRIGHHLDWNNLRTFNEKIQWEKLYHEDPIKVKLADKYLVREWVKERIGEKYLIPLLGVWDRFDDIDFNCLPQSFVLKTNHASGTIIIVKDKNRFDKKDARSRFNDWMQMDYAYNAGFEMHYSKIDRKIIAERYLEDKQGELPDYKFLCFDGVPYYCWVDKGRFTNHTRNIFDMDWNLQEWVIGPYGNYKDPIEKPKSFELMVNLARTLSEGFPHVRVDFYNIDGTIYFGEMTFTSGSGYEAFSPEEYDLKIGELWHIDTNASNSPS